MLGTYFLRVSLSFISIAIVFGFIDLNLFSILVFIERGELDEWAIGRYVLPFIEADYQSVNGKEKVVVRLLQSLGDGVKLSLVAAGVIGLRLA